MKTDGVTNQGGGKRQKNGIVVGQVVDWHTKKRRKTRGGGALLYGGSVLNCEKTGKGELLETKKGTKNRHTTENLEKTLTQKKIQRRGSEG